MTLHDKRPTRSRRAGHENSRNGCFTCKIRRVKCDETHPYCRKCTESGRKCEGPIVRQFRFFHDQPLSRSTTPTPQLEVSLLAPPHNKDERRAFHYYTHRAAPVFAGTVDASFWEDLVPRLAQRYGFVWDIVVCLGSLLEHVPYMSLTTTYDSAGLPKVTNREHRMALRVYNRAIVNVRQLTERDHIDDSVVVLSCILFASVEFQQRNVKTGNDLVKRCSKILTEKRTPLHARQNSTASQAVYEVITPFVLRRAILFATLGNALPPQWVGANKVSNTPVAIFSKSPTHNETRAQFHILMHHCYEVIRHADFIPNFKDDHPGKLLFLSQRQLLLEKLMLWKEAFTTASCQTSDLQTECIGSYLLMYWAVCYTSLATCDSLYQTIFDDHMAQFADILKHATVCVRHSDQAAKAQLNYDFGPGVIPPLYFCATKCRDPILRREALHLMRQVPMQESFWAFVASDQVIAKIISVEEGVDQLSSSKDSPESRYAGLPPEKSRFAYTSVVGRQAPGGKQCLALELSRFECATDGSRKLINEYVCLND